MTAVSDIFDAGVKAYSEGRFEDSFQHFHEIIEHITTTDKSTSYAVWLCASYSWKGRICERNFADIDSALKFYDLALDAFQSDSVLNNRGLLFMDHYNDIESAERDFREALSLCADNDDVLNNLGLVCERKQKFDEALAYFNKSIEINPTDPLTYSNRARLLTEHFRKHLEALADYNKSIELGFNYKAYNHRGILHRDVLRNYDLAIQDFDTLITMDSKDFISYGHKSYVLYLQGKYDEASDCADQAIAGNARFAFYVKGLLYIREGKTDLAVKHLQKFIRMGCWNASFLEDAEKRLKELGKG